MDSAYYGLIVHIGSVFPRITIFILFGILPILATFFNGVISKLVFLVFRQIFGYTLTVPQYLMF